MALAEVDLSAAQLSKSDGSRKHKNAEVGQKPSAALDAEAQDEHLWECAIANSLDAIRDLADKALADKQAGRTRRITL